MRDARSRAATRHRRTATTANVCGRAGSVPAEREQRALKSVERLATSRTLVRPKFKLDYAVAEHIKHSYRPFLSKDGKRPAVTDKAATQKNTGAEMYKGQNEIQEITMRYGFGKERVDTIMREFLYLYKASRYAQTHSVSSLRSSVQTSVTSTPSGSKPMDEQMVKRLLEIITISPTEQVGYLGYEDYGKLRVNTDIVKVYIKKFAEMSHDLFSRIMLGIDIDTRLGQMGLDELCRIHYYFLEMQANPWEYIQFGLKFMDPGQTGNTTLEEISRLLRSIITKESGDPRGELLVRALLSNLVLCGVFDADGRFQPAVFESVFRGEKMNISNFVKVLLS